MEEQLISFETAKLAKESGFDIFSPDIYPLKDFYGDYKTGELACVLAEESMDREIAWEGGCFCYAPTQSLLQKWLREKHKKDIVLMIDGGVKHTCYRTISHRQDKNI